MDTQEPKMIFKFKNASKEAQAEFNKRVIELVNKKLGAKKEKEEYEKIIEELKMKYGTQ